MRKRLYVVLRMFTLREVVVSKSQKSNNLATVSRISIPYLFRYAPRCVTKGDDKKGLLKEVRRDHDGVEKLSAVALKL